MEPYRNMIPDRGDRVKNVVCLRDEKKIKVSGAWWAREKWQEMRLERDAEVISHGLWRPR